MYANVLAAAILLAYAKADVAAVSDAGLKVKGDVDTLSSLVAGWSKDKGLAGALAIQQSFEPLVSDVNALDSAVGSLGSISSSDVEGALGTLDTLVSSVSSLLSALVEKASDFSAVGASTIVGGDISTLLQPSKDIASNLFAALPSDADAAVFSSASSLGAAFAAAFSSGGSAYSVDVGEFPSAPTGGSGSGSGSSSAAASSAAASSAAASSAAATSAAASSAAHSSAAVSAAQSTAVAPANGAGVAAMGLGAAAAGVAALLL